MEKVITVAQVVVPIFTAIILGMVARKRSLLTQAEVRGFQQFVMKFGLPCVVFNSCLTADIGAESLTSMGLALSSTLFGTFWAFRARKGRYPYANLPQLFAAQETGMLGIPLFMILFGAEQAYRIGVLDLAQGVTAFPVIALLSAGAGENPGVKDIVKKVLASPLLIMCIIGLSLNVSGIGGWLHSLGLRDVLTESASFLSQPVSAMMIFSVGYNFSLGTENRKDIIQISLIHFVMFTVFGVLMQLALFLMPQVDPMTRWALLMYAAMPASYLATSLGRTEEDAAMASGVCSILTVVSLMIFCAMAVAVA